MQDLIDSDGPILSRMEEVMAILAKENLCTKLVLPASSVLVHPDNRGTLGINPFDCHRLGSEIKALGADLKEVRYAVCIELSRHRDLRHAQVSYNCDLVAASGGLLAPVTGREKVLSVGGGHLAAFVRAALAECRTASWLAG